MQVGAGHATPAHTEVAVTSQHQPDHTDQQNPDEERVHLSGGEWVALAVAGAVGIGGAYLSYESVSAAAAEKFQSQAAGTVVPLVVDGMILVALVLWVTSALAGRRASWWRWIAYSGVALTITLNAASVWPDAGAVLLHIVGPIVYSVLAEGIAAHIAKRWRELSTTDSDHIPGRLWLVAPGESFRTSLRMARTGERSAAVARIEADRCELAVLSLRRALKGRQYRRDRRMLTRRLAAGSLEPLHVLTVLREGGWIGSDSIGRSDRIESTGSDRIDPQSIVWRCLGSGLEAGSDRASGGSSGAAVAGEVDQAPAVDRPASGLLAIESAPNGSGPRANGHTPAVAAAAQPEPRTVVHEITARQQDLDAIQAAITSGELPSEPSASAIMKALNIGPKYARAARDHITSNGHSGTAETP